ncbi:MAG: hypothetical protein JO370_01835, partial [Paucibacter sp.]|nr:hypothetical protein [Roseateles sp.]
MVNAVNGMSPAVGFSTLSAINSAALAMAKVKPGTAIAELQDYQRQLADTVQNGSANTPAGMVRIEWISSRIADLQASQQAAAMRAAVDPGKTTSAAL